jgi:hypothetical protein
MAKKQTNAQAMVSVLDQPPEGRLLRVRNVSPFGLAIPSTGKESDIFLGVQGEVVISAEWAKNPNLRRVVGNGHVEVEWVSEGYLPRAVPDPDMAPEEARPETVFDTAYAREIALAKTADALERINHQIISPDTGGADIRFMKGRFLKILKFARWMEERVQNRQEILKAIDHRLQEIQAM